MTDLETRDRVTRLETRLDMIETLVNDKLDVIERDVREIKDLLAMGKGGWKVLAGIAGVLVTLTSLGLYIYEKLSGR